MIQSKISLRFLLLPALSLAIACVSDETLDDGTTSASTSSTASTTATGTGTNTATSGTDSTATTSTTDSTATNSNGSTSDSNSETTTSTDTTTTSGVDPLTCVPGSTIPAADNCNTCQCPESGKVNEATSCTEIACECADNTACRDWAFCMPADHECKVTTGQCQATPEACDAGGSGACGCDGQYYLNECEANAQRVGVNALGGCEPTQDTFQCGSVACASASQFCSVQYNDVLGPDEPLLTANCVDLPQACNGVASCECLNVEAPNRCEVIQGHYFAVYVGG